VKTTYFDEDDTLVIRLSDKPIVGEVSQDWNTHISGARPPEATERPLGGPRAHASLGASVQLRGGWFGRRDRDPRSRAQRGVAA